MRLLSESGFIGLKDFQDSFGGARILWAGACPYSDWRDFGLRRKARGWARRNPENPVFRERAYLSESGFIGLKDFQDSYGGARLRRVGVCPHSAWRDFGLWRKARGWAERNPENPNNPINPDSDKRRAQPTNPFPFAPSAPPRLCVPNSFGILRFSRRIASPLNRRAACAILMSDGREPKHPGENRESVSRAADGVRLRLYDPSRKAFGEGTIGLNGDAQARPPEMKRRTPSAR